MTFSAWKIRTVLLAASFGMFSIAGQAASTKAYTFTSFEYPNAYNTQTGNINNRGQVVGTANGAPEAPARLGFLYEDGEFSKILFPGSFETFADGINDRGQIVGSALIQGGLVAYFYDGNFTKPQVPGASMSFANGINNRGYIVGTYYDFNSNPTAGIGVHAFLYADCMYQTIELEGTKFLTPSGINDHGQIVGYYVLGDIEYGFFYDKGVFTQLLLPGSIATLAEGINNKGQIVGAYSPKLGESHGFIYEDGEYQTVDVPESTSTFATGINDRGEISGFSGQSNMSHGFIGTPKSDSNGKH
jgi:probable HAF family extracellular repeat protein